ncbi:MAG: transcriptional regulator [Zetaproteobacteria bacterium]|nr:MAG: transcriptional regulator [Zetaproteobacteria bacterium]
MSIERDIALVNELLLQPAEQPWLEFKHNNCNEEIIGKLCSALSNASRSEGRETAYLLWGIEDGTRDIIGTNFDPSLKLVGNQDFQLWLAQRLNPSISFSFRKINHPDGDVVMLEIPAPTTSPIEFNGTAYIRIGSTTPKLSAFPERFVTLMEKIRPYAWEAGIAKQFVTGDDVLNLLDYTNYFKLTNHPLPDNRDGIFERLEAERLIMPDVGGKWNITNLGAILFANDLEDFNVSMARKAVRFVAYGGKNKTATVTHRQDGKRGYAVGFSGLVGYINGLLPRNEHIGEAFREAQPLFPELAIRELVANALIHQDMTISGAGPQIELFEDRMEITNPGKPLVEVSRMIDLPPRSRNEAMAAFMRRIGLCEEQGSGLDKVVAEAEIYQLPAPDFRENQGTMQVVLYGPRSFANMTPDERVRACFQHAILKWISGEKMKNASLCKRFGIDRKNAAQATTVINRTLEADLVKVADPAHPRAGYVPIWA